ncbi:Cof-type HAD-IIB family hydrolase [Zophobihabitans entericus]|uniref:Cof-type HAD-IIB family hydrolase n=1 Tax=Zophobihabitans entericus TaxID=1635327 RepID=A0A6G9IA70_9GAMM|nr:Cof-type HAD-IIB family hydrolase [Zophobihabitans entericus]QIQ20480.1 Cof-type HAD-IIB family hydrolase [Zophobihabitans entericus]
MSKPQAIVFFDLDGTLLTSDVTVATSSINAIQQLHKNNIIPMISTGRTVCEVKHIMDQTKMDSIVAMNGQCVLYRGEQVFTNDIDKSVIERLVTFSKERNIPVAFYNDESMHISDDSQQAYDLYRYLRQSPPPVDANAHHKYPIQMLLLLCQDGEQDYPKAFPELTFIRNTPYCVDVFNKGGSKGNGIKKLLAAKNFADVPTYAFGDGMNDIEMFKIVDHPVAMSNAVEPIKALAEYITDSNNHDGIANGLKKFGLI